MREAAREPVRQEAAPGSPPPVPPGIASSCRPDDLLHSELWSYLEAEKAWLETATAGSRELRRTLHHEMRERLPVRDLSVPARNGPYLYYRRAERGLSYQVLCRRRDEPGAAEEVLMDENRLAGDGFCHVGSSAVSPDHALLAYAVDRRGDERFEIFVKDLGSGELLAALPDGSGHLAWASDSRTLFWVGLDEHHRRARLLRHEIGGGTVLVAEEPDERFHLAVGRSESGAWILVTAASRSTTEVRVLDAATPRGALRTVCLRREGVEASLSHLGEHFYVLTNEDGARGGKVLRAPVEAPPDTPWTEVVPCRPGVVIEDLRAFSKHLVLFLRERGRHALRVLDVRTGGWWDAPPPDEAGALLPAENLEHDTSLLRIGYSSLTQPDSIWEVDLERRQLTLLKREEVPGHEPGAYRSERITARAADGAEVPISLVYRRDLRRPQGNPLLLYGYGAYGLCVEPTFSASRLSLLDRGFVFAIAHVRGGGELGPDWHDQGRRLLKPNSFGDFIACAEELVRRGLADPDRLAALGESAGGLLVAAVANQRPDLFAALVARMPFVDVLGAAADQEEWGDPADPVVRDAMAAYSPCDNVRPQPYPAMLVTAALHDPRVPFLEPVRWVARLRTVGTGDRPLLLRLEDAGHDGPSGRDRSLEEMAFLYAFLLDLLAPGA